MLSHGMLGFETVFDARLADALGEPIPNDANLRSLFSVERARRRPRVLNFLPGSTNKG